MSGDPGCARESHGGVGPPLVCFTALGHLLHDCFLPLRIQWQAFWLATGLLNVRCLFRYCISSDASILLLENTSIPKRMQVTQKKKCLCNLTMLETTRQQKYANQSVTRWKTHPSQKGCKSPRKKIVSLQSNYVGNHPSTEICKPVSDPNALHDAILLSIS